MKKYFDKNFKEKCAQESLKQASKFSWEKCVNIITDEIEKSLS